MWVPESVIIDVIFIYLLNFGLETYIAENLDGCAKIFSDYVAWQSKAKEAQFSFLLTWIE